jgi:hypothetical protein
MQNMSLFGGALDTPNSLDGERKPSPPTFSMPPPSSRAGDLGAEEAANLLLAFSSPETLRPSKTGSTPIMSALSMPPGQRRGGLDDEFSLDGGHAKGPAYNSSHNHSREGQGAFKPRQGKTARDILRM